MVSLKNEDLTVLLASLLLTLYAWVYGFGMFSSYGTGTLIRAPFLYGKQRKDFSKYVQL